MKHWYLYADNLKKLQDWKNQVHVINVGIGLNLILNTYNRQTLKWFICTWWKWKELFDISWTTKIGRSGESSIHKSNLPPNLSLLQDTCASVRFYLLYYLHAYVIFSSKIPTTIVFIVLLLHSYDTCSC